jgi:predicted phosphoribosyltransferase
MTVRALMIASRERCLVLNIGTAHTEGGPYRSVSEIARAVFPVLARRVMEGEIEDMMRRLFRDRREAGRLLAAQLAGYANRPGVLVLALPRGGVPVGFEVARALGAPLDVFVVRKLGVPGHEELAMGAIATGGVRILNEALVRALGVPDHLIEAVAAKKQEELARREGLYRGDRPAPDVRGRTVILVDDGLATGATMQAAVKALRQQHPARIVIAVPIAAPETCDDLKTEADDVVCAVTPEPFYAVGLWYEDFTQTTDEEVRDLLARSVQPGRAAGDINAGGDRYRGRGNHASHDRGDTHRRGA